MKLLIIADDLTGALDTGVQLVKAGVIPHVIIDLTKPLPRITDTQAFVLNAETRHLPKDDAYQIVFNIVKRALNAGFDHIYKKTDSALRGNIGSELAALLDASGETLLPFFPSYPKMNRFTVDGVQYIDGTPVSESVFGIDPFEPVRYSNIADIVAQQSSIPVQIIPEGQPFSVKADHVAIAVFDCKCSQSFEALARQLKPHIFQTKISAGCAGFAEFLPSIFELKGKKSVFSLPEKDILVCSGSLNPITIRQLDMAIVNGFECFNISNYDARSNLSHPDFRESFAQNILTMAQNCPNLILRVGKSDLEMVSTINGTTESTFEKAGQQIASNIGALLSEVVRMGLDRNLIITGGDILQSFITQVCCDEVIPLGEIESGIVLSLVVIKNKKITVVSKSGGFGSQDIFSKIASYLQKIHFVL